MKRWLLTIFVVPFLTIPAPASGCRQVIRSNYVAPVYQQANVYKAAAIVYPVVATYVVPLYGAAYVPLVPAAPAVKEKAKDDEVVDAIKQLIEVSKQMDQRLQRLEGGPMKPADPPKPTPGDPFNPQGLKQGTNQGEQDVVKLFSAKCAGCHDAANFTAKGGGFGLIDNGKLAPIPPEAKLKIVAQVYGGTMPKNKPPLSDEEVSVVMKWVAGK